MKLIRLFCLAVLCFFSIIAFAANGPHATVELLMGSAYSSRSYLNAGTSGNGFALGARAGYYPEKFGLRSHKISFRMSLVRMWAGKKYIQGLQARERVYFLNFDAAKDFSIGKRLEFVVHGSPVSVVRDSLSFAENAGYYGWQSICPYSQGACQSKWSFLGNEGVSVHYFPGKKPGNFFLGGDYTHFAGRKYLAGFTLGGKF